MHLELGFTSHVNIASKNIIKTICRYLYSFDSEAGKPKEQPLQSLLVTKCAHGQ